MNCSGNGFFAGVEYDSVVGQLYRVLGRQSGLPERTELTSILFCRLRGRDSKEEILWRCFR